MLRAGLSRPILDAAGQMALDEAVLASAAPGALVLRIYRWAGRDCTFGYARSFADARRACEALGWADVSPVRRSTGGGIVFHGEDVTFSLVFPWDRLCAPDAVYKNVHRGIHLALKAAGAATGLWSPPVRPDGAASACFSRAEPMDLVDAAGRKVLGGALRKRGAIGLYQGSMRPEGLGLSRGEIEAAISDGVAREFGRPAETEIGPERIEAGREIEARYRSPEWNQRRP